jgi:hypothetical protein
VRRSHTETLELLHFSCLIFFKGTIMKTSSFVTALILTATVGTFSTLSHAGEQDFSFAGPASVHSNVTREAVRADYFKAVNGGTQLLAGERDYAANTVAIPVLQMGKSRTQVKSELQMALLSGERLSY